MALLDFGVLCTGRIHDDGGKFMCFAHWAWFIFPLHSTAILAKDLLSTLHLLVAIAKHFEPTLALPPNVRVETITIEVFIFSVFATVDPFTSPTCLELEVYVQLWKRYLYFLWITPFNFWVCWVRLSFQFRFSVFKRGKSTMLFFFLSQTREWSKLKAAVDHCKKRKWRNSAVMF